MLGEALVSDVILAANGTMILVAMRDDAIADIVALRTKKADELPRAAELMVCRASKPTLPLIVGATLDIIVAVPSNASLPATATRDDAIADIVALKAKKDGSGPRIAELIV